MKSFTLFVSFLFFCFTTSNAQNTLLHLSFNDSTLTDNSGNNPLGTGYDIIYNSGSCNSTGIYVNGTVTNNVASSVQIADSSILRPDNNFTLSAWAMYTDSSLNVKYPYVVAKRYAYATPPFDSYGILVDNSHSSGIHSYWMAVIGDSLGQHRVISSGKVELGVWTHLALTLNNNTLSLYVNGFLANSTTLQPHPILYSSLPFTVGTSRINGTDTQFEGNIDEVYLFDYALSSSEISNLSNCTPLSNNQLNSPISKIELFPNPASNNINIQLKKQGLFHIVSVLGERINSYQLNEGFNSLDISQLLPGLYFLQSDNGESLKFVKQ